MDILQDEVYKAQTQNLTGAHSPSAFVCTSITHSSVVMK